MTELSIFTAKFGPIIGPIIFLVVFIAYKEIPLWLKKRNGQWVEYADNTKTINEIKTDLTQHILDDKTIQVKIAADLEIQKALQTQISLGIQKELTSVSEKLDKVYDLILNDKK